MERPDTHGQRLRDRFRLEHSQVAVTSSGKRFVVRAYPRGLAGGPDQWPLPWPIVVGWVAVRQFALLVGRRPGWQVDVSPAWEPNDGWLVTKASKAEAIGRANTEASALAVST